MRVERSLHDQPAVVGSAGDARSPVVVGQVLHQPINGVPRVGNLVGCLGIAQRTRRTDHLELALGFEASANVLYDANVTVGIDTIRVRMKSREGIFLGDSI